MVPTRLVQYHMYSRSLISGVIYLGAVTVGVGNANLNKHLHSNFGITYYIYISFDPNLITITASDI